VRGFRAGLVVLVGVSIGLATGCQSCRGPVVEESKGPAVTAPEAYTPPPPGASSLVDSVSARRDSSGSVVVEGKLLPASTRVWVELFPAGSAPDASPIDRAELYLGSGGTFRTDPLKAPTGSEFRILITSHFTPSWQSSEVLAGVGTGGLKLPRAALMPNNPNNPQSAGHLEYSGVLKVE
jgi:hypothetical protein